MYFSRPIRFSRTLVCGPFKNLWFSCRRYFRVPLLILLAASPLACHNFFSRTLTIPPATQASRRQTTNHKYCFSTNQRKNQNLVFEHMIRQVNVSCPSTRLNSEFTKPRRRRRGQRRMRNEFIFYQRISLYSKVIYFV